MKKNTLFFLCALLSAIYSGNAQVTILSSGFHSMNVTPSSLFQITVMNAENELTVTMEAEVSNSSGQSLLKVTSLPVKLINGINQFAADYIKSNSTVYGQNEQAHFVQTHKTLPSGTFKYCVRIVAQGSEANDEYCDEIQSDATSFLSLVSPFDADIIETSTPMLIWTHSEAFSMLAPGEFFRIVVTEKKQDQSSEAAVAANQPLFFKNSLTQHEVQYPFDAPLLQEGKTYAWKVLKMAAGGQAVIEQTDAWQFTIKTEEIHNTNKYTLLRKTLSGDYYSCSTDQLYFRFDEEYRNGNLKYEIRNDKNEKLSTEIKHDEQVEENTQLRHSGVNRFELDLAKYKLSKGYYTLIIYNQKNEKHYLKFHVVR